MSMARSKADRGKPAPPQTPPPTVSTSDGSALFMMSSHIVGTATNRVTFSDRMARTHAAALNVGMVMNVAPTEKAPMRPVRLPKRWKKGEGHRMTSSLVTPPTSADRRALLVQARWLSAQPFGKPVVPLVYCTIAGSSGLQPANDS